MSDKHRISEYIDNLTFKKSLCMGFHPDEVYEAICNLTSMYNDVLAEAYDETDSLKRELEFMKRNAELLGRRSSQITEAEQIKTKAEMNSNMNNNISTDMKSFRYGTGEGYDKGLAEMLSAIKPSSAATEKTVKADEPLFDYEKADTQADAKNTVQVSEQPENNITQNSENTQQSQEKVSEADSRPEMNDKEIQRLRRGELLEILLESSKENEKLRAQVNGLNAEIEELNGKLSDRTIKIEKAGTLAEAALLLNGVFDSAQAAAQQYLDNLQALYAREEENCVKKEAQVHALAQRLIDDTKKKCDEMTREAEAKCLSMNTLTLERCRALEEESAKKCESRELEAKAQYDAIIEKAREDAAKHWDSLTQRLEEFYNSHMGLKELLAATGHISRG